MICPHCNHSFALTWQRYLKAPRGIYTCLNCQKKSKLVHLSAQKQIIHYLLMITTVMVTGGILIYITQSLKYGCILGFIIGMLIIIPLDKRYGEKTSKLSLDSKKHKMIFFATLGLAALYCVSLWLANHFR